MGPLNVEGPLLSKTAAISVRRGYWLLTAAAVVSEERTGRSLGPRWVFRHASQPPNAVLPSGAARIYRLGKVDRPGFCLYGDAEAIIHAG